jgi:hypothetical protein
MVAHFFLGGGLVLCRVLYWILCLSQSNKLRGTPLFWVTCMCSHSLFHCSWFRGRVSILLI